MFSDLCQVVINKHFLIFFISIGLLTAKYICLRQRLIRACYLVFKQDSVIIVTTLYKSKQIFFEKKNFNFVIVEIINNANYQQSYQKVATTRSKL